MEEKKELFRRESLERISSPDQLDEYLKVTSPGLWAMLGVLVFLLLGIVVWGIFGRITTMETFEGRAEGGYIRVEVDEKTAAVLGPDRSTKVLDEEGRVLSLTQEGDTTVVLLRTTLPDGVYPVQIETEEISPASFLFSEDAP